MIFVYGTSGTLQENDWSYRKAKLDVEAFWYRGNGTVDIISDKAFDPRAEPDRSVIVYGNTDCNSAWKTVLSGSPIAVRRDSVRVGERMTGGDDLAVVFLRPRPRSSIAHVGVIAGTGAAGMRLLDRLPVFIAGVAYPDWVVMDSTTLVKGVDGVRSAGFFGNDWSMERAQAAWR